jgi:hypothetical protein
MANNAQPSNLGSKKSSLEKTTKPKLILLPSDPEDEGDCCVCYERVPLLTLQCKHKICPDCCDRWLGKPCPVCRAKSMPSKSVVSASTKNIIDEIVGNNQVQINTQRTKRSTPPVRQTSSQTQQRQVPPDRAIARSHSAPESNSSAITTSPSPQTTISTRTISLEDLVDEFANYISSLCLGGVLQSSGNETFDIYTNVKHDPGYGFILLEGAGQMEIYNFWLRKLTG